MKERPIIFSGPMVQAIRDDRKTVTRRAVQKRNFSAEVHALSADIGVRDALLKYWGQRKHIRSPYGWPGDTLWVRETWAAYRGYAQRFPVFVYRADYDDGMPNKAFLDARRPLKWKPSIYMPRRACRLLLEIITVRIERVHEISAEGCFAEGCSPQMVQRSGVMVRRDVKQAFEDLWDSINAKRGYGWQVNPWVWVVEFRRIDS